MMACVELAIPNPDGGAPLRAIPPEADGVPRPRRRVCHFCPAPADRLCDYAVPTRPPEADDRALCEQHRARQDGEVDWCPAHAREAAAARREAELVEKPPGVPAP